jgi:hypothetical protein
VVKALETSDSSSRKDSWTSSPSKVATKIESTDGMTSRESVSKIQGKEILEWKWRWIRWAEIKISTK